MKDYLYSEAEKFDFDSPEEWINDPEFIPELVRLSKKFHANPFIMLTILEDAPSNDDTDLEDSESEEDDRNKRIRFQTSDKKFQNKINFAFPPCIA